MRLTNTWKDKDRNKVKDTISNLQQYTARYYVVKMVNARTHHILQTVFPLASP